MTQTTGGWNMTNAHQVFFDPIADQWDGWMDLTRTTTRIEEGLARLSTRGRVVAVDLSPRMLELARAKNDDPRVELQQAHARDLSLAAQSMDRAICLSVWPHVDEPEKTALEIRRVLKVDG